jgi:transposase
MTTATARNRYYRRSRLGETKFRVIVRCFATDLTATDTASLTGISVRSVNSIYLRIRRRIAASCERQCLFNELPEGRFSDMQAAIFRQAGWRNGSAPTLFGIHEEAGRISTELIPNCSALVVSDVVNGRRDLHEVFGHQDWVSRYHGLVDLERQRYFRLQWPDAGSTPNLYQATRTEVFWRFAKQRLSRFRGLHRHTQYLHLMETEYRFNYPRESLYHDLLDMLRSQPL